MTVIARTPPTSCRKGISKELTWADDGGSFPQQPEKSRKERLLSWFLDGPISGSMRLARRLHNLTPEEPTAMRMISAIGLGLAWLTLAPGSAFAHHDFIAQFAPDKPLTLRGTVTRVEWTNPHGWIHVNVQGPDGQIEPWAIETGTTYRLTKGGLKSSDFKFGMEVIVDGYAARDGSRKVAGRSITFSGREGSFPLGR
jgi:hypothetical protein